MDDLDKLESVADAAAYWWDKCQDYPEVEEHIATFTPVTVKALIARCRRAEALVGVARRDSSYWRGRWCDLG